MSTNLIKYLPYEIRKYLDFKVIIEAENAEFNRIYKLSNEFLDETFISTANEYGVEKLEDMLHLKPGVNDSIEDRRLRILTRWNNAIPYTWRVFIQKLNAICGVGNYTVELINNEYIIKINTRMNTKSQYEELLFLLNRVVPANMVVQSSNTLSNNLTNTMYVGTSIIEYKSYVIS